MPAFSEHQSRLPPATVDVPLVFFAETWAERPVGVSSVTVGLRTIADSDVQAARAQAAKAASVQHPVTAQSDINTRRLWVDAFQDALMRWMVARGTCDPTDATQPPSVWAAAPEDMVKEALTSDGVGFLYDAWERMRIACDIFQPSVDDAELTRGLGPVLREAFQRVSATDRAKVVRARKLLAFILTDLGVEPPAADDDESDPESLADDADDDVAAE